MEAEGVTFDSDQLEKTRSRFLQWRCRANI